MRSFLLLIGWLAASVLGAATIEDSFNAVPVTRGWQIFGEMNLFRWNSADENLEVTWDSSRSNSFYFHPLGTVVTRADDFQLGFDLRLRDVQVGVNPARPFTFQLAVGLLNIAEASRASFWRGVGVDAANGPRDLVEFDYFPDSGFGATVSPAIVSSNNQFATSFNFPIELATNDWFHVEVIFSAATQTLATTMLRNGTPFSEIKTVTLGPSFTDFRVDTFAIASYTDAGADGSLLAQGEVDNVQVTVPDPPAFTLLGEFANGHWQISFAAQPNWFYALERTLDLQNWETIATTNSAAVANLLLIDPQPPADRACYRVQANHF